MYPVNKPSNTKRPLSDLTVDAQPSQALKINKDASPSAPILPSNAQFTDITPEDFKEFDRIAKEYFEKKSPKKIQLTDEIYSDDFLKELESIEKEHIQKKAPLQPVPVPQLTPQYQHSRAKKAPENNNCKVELIKKNRKLQKLLNDLIDSARERILITTESVGFIPDEILDALRDACDRGVKIWIVSNKPLSEQKCDFLEEQGISCEELNIHGKHLIVDKRCAVIGSANWLNLSDEDVELDDHVIKISRNKDYVDKIWRWTFAKIISYRKVSIAKMNDEPLPYVEHNKPHLELPINNSSRILLLTTLQQHNDYLKFICRDAKKSITIYSPFISIANAKKRLDLIAEVIKKDVKLCIVLNEYDLIDNKRDKYQVISDFIKHHPKLKDLTTITPHKGFHRKTLMIDCETDNPTLSEGSFNWLSSAMSTESEFHNQDTSLVIQGPIVRNLVKEKPRRLRH